MLALGSAAPEIVLNTVSAIEHARSLSLTAVLGSAMIAFGLIPALCILVTNQDHLKLSVWPIVREVTFFSISLLLFLISIKDGSMTTVECVGLISLYFLYVSVVLIVYYYRPKTIKIESSGSDNEDKELGITGSQEKDRKGIRNDR